jgi:hypothetical protein
MRFEGECEEAKCKNDALDAGTVLTKMIFAF